MFCRWFLCLSMLALVSCASRPPAHREQGWASYVADQYTGRPTSSGEIYYPQAYTAAHTTLPFGTVVTVKNMLNGRTVNVTVNDRFPYYQGRVINLSSAAAQHIGIPYMQMGQVEVTAKTVAQSPYGTPARSQLAYGGYAQSPSYYAPQPAAPAYSAQPSYGAYTPKSTPPAYSAPSYQVQQPAASSVPMAPSYSGASATPPGLKTF